MTDVLGLTKNASSGSNIANPELREGLYKDQENTTEYKERMD